MNFNLSQIPHRNPKPRESGLTMVMDKGLSVEEAKNFLDVAHPHVDIIKLGFGTSYVTSNLDEKLEVFRSYNIPIYFGGTLFEAFLVRGQLEDYIEVCKRYGVEYIEVSDGSVDIPHKEKCGYIERLSKNGKILSEVGSKDAAHIIPPYKWIELMRAELSAGASYVIAEARESGNVGIYRGSGEVREGLVQEILTQIPGEKIIWEAPKKNNNYILLNCLAAMLTLEILLLRK